MKELSSAFLCLVGLLVSGCSLRVTDAASVNRSLTYVPWSTAKDCENKVPKSAEINVRPGMRLVFRSSALAAQHGNGLTPRLNEFAWIVPRDRFVPDDYIVIGHLLAASKREPDVDDVQLLKGIGSNAPEDDFYTQINKKLYAPLVVSMTWLPLTQRSSGNAALCPVPASLRQAVAEPTKKDFDEAKRETPQLQFMVNDKKFEFGGGSAPYFNHNVSTITEPSLWYLAGALGARVLVTVEVPVRLQPELLSRFVPPYTTFGDLEQELGVEVTGFRRSREFFDDRIPINTHWPYFDRKDVIADDGYFTVWFSRWRGWARHESTPALVAHIPKKDLLVAPGDVVLVNLNDRKRATDDQAVR